MDSASLLLNGEQAIKNVVIYFYRGLIILNISMHFLSKYFDSLEKQLDFLWENWGGKEWLYTDSEWHRGKAHK